MKNKLKLGLGLLLVFSMLTACENNSNKKPVIIDDDTAGEPSEDSGNNGNHNDDGTDHSDGDNTPDGSETKTLTGIEISSQPTKIIYQVGDAFSSEGLVVKAVYSDQSKEIITDYQLSQPDMSTAGPKTVTVTYNGKTASFQITVNAKTQQKINMTNEAEAYAVSHPGTWVYWADQDWCGSIVTAAADENYTQGDEVHGKYAVTKGPCTYGYQIFYKNPTLQNGVKYKQTFKITSAVALELETINGKVQLEAGVEKSVEVHYWQTEGISFKAVFPVQNGQNNTITIKDIANEQSLILDAPLNLAIDGDFKVTFTDATNATGYEVKVMDSDANVVDGFNAVEVTKNNAIPGFSALPDGIYDVAIRSKAEGFVTSDWSQAVRVVKGNIEPDPFENYDSEHTTFEYGSENGDWGATVHSVNHPGTLYYWNDGAVTVSAATIVDKVITLSYSVNEGANCDWGEQIFFKNPYLTTGKTYKIKFTLQTEAAGKIGINHSDNKSIDVTAGSQNMEREYVENANQASLCIVLPTSLVKGDRTNTVIISNIEWVAVA